MRNYLKLLPIICMVWIMACQKSNPEVLNEESKFAKGENAHPFDPATINPDDVIDFEDLVTRDLSELDYTIYEPSNLEINFTVDNNNRSVVLNEKMLHFADTNKLFDAINIFEYQFDSILNNWEILNGLTSLRRSYEDLIITDLVDLESLMPPIDLTIESMINTDYSYRVDDRIIVYLLEEKLNVIYNINTQTVDYFDMDINSSATCIGSEKDDKFKCYNGNQTPTFTPCVTNWSGDYVLYCRKANFLDVFTSSISMQVWLMKMNSHGGGYQMTTENLHMRKDQWHKVSWRWNKNASHVTHHLSDLWVHAKKAKAKLKYVFTRKNGVMLEPFCVEAFERVHAWPFNYEQDLHHEFFQ